MSLWFRRSYERVLQRDTNVGTGTLVRATPAGSVPRCRIGGYHEDHGPLGRSTLHARRGNPLGRYQLLAAEVGIRAVLLKRRLDEAPPLMLATSKEERYRRTSPGAAALAARASSAGRSARASACRRGTDSHVPEPARTKRSRLKRPDARHDARLMPERCSSAASRRDRLQTLAEQALVEWI